MKKMGRKNRPYYRLCAIDIRRPQGGRVLEELGSYDPEIRETDARAILNGERIAHWMARGAQPTPKVHTLIKKYGKGGTHLAAAAANAPKAPEPGAAPAETAAEAPAEESAGGDEAAS
jgi:small subunit ribosomal protein S16